MRAQAGTDTASASLPVRSRRPLGAGLSGARVTVEVYRAVGGFPSAPSSAGSCARPRTARSTVQVLLADRPAEDPETPTCPGELGRDLVPGLPSEFAGAVVQSSELAFQLAVRMLVETLRLGADADDNTVEAAVRALVGRLD